MPPIQKGLKVVAFLLLLTFLSEQFLYAYPEPEKLRLSPGQREDFLPWAKSTLPKFPDSVAVIEDAFQASNVKERYPLVILVQDAHTNDSGQINLAKTLDLLFSSSLHPSPFVFTEAASKNASLSYLRNKAPLESRKRTALSFLKKGLLHGAEYLDLTSDHSFQIWGVENPEDYKKSLEIYAKVFQEREKFQNYLDQIDQTIQTLRPQILNPVLMRFTEKHESYEDGKMPLTDFFEILNYQSEMLQIDLSRYPHLEALKKLKDKEKKINFEKANAEQVEAIRSLPQRDQEELKVLVDSAKREVSKISQKEERGGKAFYDFLKERLNLENYPELRKYLDYLELAKNLEAKELLGELDSLTEKIFEGLISTPDESKLIACAKTTKLLHRLLNLTLTVDEYDAYKKISREWTIENLSGFLNEKIMDLRKYEERAVFLESGYDKIVQRAEDFYELTFKRDENFVQQMLDKLKEEKKLDHPSILVTGGFHSSNLKNILKERNISYISIVPQVFNETNQRRYESILLNQKMPISASRNASASTLMTVLAKSSGDFPVLYENGEMFDAQVLERVLVAEAGRFEGTRLAKMPANGQIARRGFLAGTLAFLMGAKRDKSSQKSPRLLIDAQKVLQPANPLVLGSNVQWMDNADGLLDPTSGKFNPQIIQQIRRLNPTVLRFPGGTATDAYKWKESRNFHLDKGEYQDSNFNLDKFLELCRLVGAQAIITVNIATGTADEAAELVAYVQKKAPKLRVRYEIGNEPYLESKLPDLKKAQGQKNFPEVFASRFKEFALAIKKVNPKAEIGLPLRNAKLGRYPSGLYADWNDRVLPISGPHADFVTIHNAYFPGIFDANEYSPTESFKALMAASEEVSDDIDRTFRYLQKKYPNRRIPVAITEFNSFFATPNLPQFKLTASLGSAIYVASLLTHLFKKKSDSLLMANFWSLNGNSFFGSLTPVTNKPRPQYYALYLFSKYVGREILDSDAAKVPTFESKANGFMPERSSTKTLDTLISKTGDTVFVILVNKSIDQDIPVQIHLKEIRPNSRLGAEILGGPSIQSDNEEKETVLLQSRELKIEDLDQLIVPKHSVVAIRIDQNPSGSRLSEDNLEENVKFLNKDLMEAMEKRFGSKKTDFSTVPFWIALDANGKFQKISIEQPRRKEPGAIWLRFILYGYHKAGGVQVYSRMKWNKSDIKRLKAFFPQMPTENIERMIEIVCSRFNNQGLLTTVHVPRAGYSEESEFELKIFSKDRLIIQKTLLQSKSIPRETYPWVDRPYEIEYGLEEPDRVIWIDRQNEWTRTIELDDAHKVRTYAHLIDEAIEVLSYSFNYLREFSLDSDSLDFVETFLARLEFAKTESQEDWDDDSIFGARLALEDEEIQWVRDLSPMSQHLDQKNIPRLRGIFKKLFPYLQINEDKKLYSENTMTEKEFANEVLKLASKIEESEKETLLRVLILLSKTYNASAHLQAIRLYQLQDYAEGLFFLEAALALDPKNENLLSDRGIAYFHAGRHEEAHRIYAKRLEANRFSRNDTTSYAYLRLADVAAIVRAFKEALRSGNFANAAGFMKQAEYEIKEAESLFYRALNSYRSHQDDSTQGVPRAMSGFASLIMLSADMYFQAARNEKFVRLKDYVSLSVIRSIQAFQYAEEALEIDPSNEHSIGIYNDSIDNLDRSIALYEKQNPFELMDYKNFEYWAQAFSSLRQTLLRLNAGKIKLTPQNSKAQASLVRIEKFRLAQSAVIERIRNLEKRLKELFIDIATNEPSLSGEDFKKRLVSVLSEGIENGNLPEVSPEEKKCLSGIFYS